LAHLQDIPEYPRAKYSVSEAPAQSTVPPSKVPTTSADVPDTLTQRRAVTRHTTADRAVFFAGDSDGDSDDGIGFDSRRPLLSIPASAVVTKDPVEDDGDGSTVGEKTPPVSPRNNAATPTRPQTQDSEPNPSVRPSDDPQARTSTVLPDAARNRSPERRDINALLQALSLRHGQMAAALQVRQQNELVELQARHRAERAELQRRVWAEQAAVVQAHARASELGLTAGDLSAGGLGGRRAVSHVQLAQYQPAVQPQAQAYQPRPVVGVRPPLAHTPLQRPQNPPVAAVAFVTPAVTVPAHPRIQQGAPAPDVEQGGGSAVRRTLSTASIYNPVARHVGEGAAPPNFGPPAGTTKHGAATPAAATAASPTRRRSSQQPRREAERSRAAPPAAYSVHMPRSTSASNIAKKVSVGFEVVSAGAGQPSVASPPSGSVGSSSDRSSSSKRSSRSAVALSNIGSAGHGTIAVIGSGRRTKFLFSDSDYEDEGEEAEDETRGTSSQSNSRPYAHVPRGHPELRRLERGEPLLRSDSVLGSPDVGPPAGPSSPTVTGFLSRQAIGSKSATSLTALRTAAAWVGAPREVVGEALAREESAARQAATEAFRRRSDHGGGGGGGILGLSVDDPHTGPSFMTQYQQQLRLAREVLTVPRGGGSNVAAHARVGGGGVVSPPPHGGVPDAPAAPGGHRPGSAKPAVMLPIRAFPSAPFLPALVGGAQGGRARTGTSRDRTVSEEPGPAESTNAAGNGALASGDGRTLGPAAQQQPPLPQRVHSNAKNQQPSSGRPLAPVTASAIPIANPQAGPHAHVLAAAAKHPDVAAAEAEEDALAAAAAARARANGVPRSRASFERRFRDLRAHHVRQLDALREQHRVLEAAAGARGPPKAVLEHHRGQLRALLEVLQREELALVETVRRVLGNTSVADFLPSALAAQAFSPAPPPPQPPPPEVDAPNLLRPGSAMGLQTHSAAAATATADALERGIEPETHALGDGHIQQRQEELLQQQQLRQQQLMRQYDQQMRYFLDKQQQQQQQQPTAHDLAAAQAGQDALRQQALLRQQQELQLQILQQQQQEILMKQVLEQQRQLLLQQRALQGHLNQHPQGLYPEPQRSQTHHDPATIATDSVQFPVPPPSILMRPGNAAGPAAGAVVAPDSGAVRHVQLPDDSILVRHHHPPRHMQHAPRHHQQLRAVDTAVPAVAIPSAVGVGGSRLDAGDAAATLVEPSSNGLASAAAAAETVGGDDDDGADDDRGGYGDEADDNDDDDDGYDDYDDDVDEDGYDDDDDEDYFSDDEYDGGGGDYSDTDGRLDTQQQPGATPTALPPSTPTAAVVPPLAPPANALALLAGQLPSRMVALQEFTVGSAGGLTPPQQQATAAAVGGGEGVADEAEQEEGVEAEARGGGGGGGGRDAGLRGRRRV
ncbi:hypothetical protein HK405_004785, partial [Cladochytrium tenue]